MCNMFFLVWAMVGCLMNTLPTHPDSQDVEILFAGDAMLHEQQLDAARRPDGSYDFSPYYKAIQPYIASADYAVVNLETPLGGAPYSGYPEFCAPDCYLTPLIDAGFDLFLTANNHALDRRDKGAIRTIHTLDKAGVSHIGTYINAQSRKEALPMIKELNGIKVAFLNFTYGTNGIPVQGDVVVDLTDPQAIASDVDHARKAGAEIITVCIHWGEEYRLLPDKSQREMAQYLTDLGVDLIIGGHPHVIQPMEIRHSNSHNKDIFLCYSLGNFISAMRKTDTRGGALARVTIGRDNNGKAIVKKATYRLVVTIRPENGEKNFRLAPAEVIAPSWMESRRKDFVTSARNIFDHHNINVPLDTLPIEAYSHKQLIGQLIPRFNLLSRLGF